MESRWGSRPDRSEPLIASCLDCLWDKGQWWDNLVNGLVKKPIQCSTDRTMGSMLKVLN